MDKINNAQNLRLIFSESQILNLQLKYYNAVCCQPKHQYTENNQILELVGGEPILIEKENVFD
jgi:hypothetical protein